MWHRIASVITEHTDQLFELDSAQAIGGGCIHACYKLEGKDSRRYFLKTHSAEASALLRCEFNALRILRETQSIYLPKPLHMGTTEDKAYLLLEYIEFGGPPNPERMGQQLAALHLNTGEQYGWHEDNFIGLAPQKNTQNYDWIDFFRTERLAFQIRLNHDRGYRYKQAQALLDKIEAFFAGYLPVPSLLHGDLWSGNAAYTRNGYPIIFDPAAYYGDRETDLAMTELFGGFPTGFYDAYNRAWPLDPGYAERKQLYQLYHILNHAYLFGGGYVSQAESCINALHSRL